MADSPFERSPDFTVVIKMMEVAREATRIAASIDGVLTVYLQKIGQWPGTPKVET